METGSRLRTLLLLEIHLCVFFVPLSVRGHPSSTQEENVIDLLAALNMSHPIKGVSRLQGESPGTLVYKLRPRAPYLILPREYSHFLFSTLQGSMGVHLVGRQALDSSATLLSLSSASSPILQIFSSTHNNTLRLDYQAVTGAWGLTGLRLPLGNPFSGADWVQLAVSLEPDRLALFVDCQEAVVLHRKGDERINLVLPQDLVVALASTPGQSDSKFIGYLKTAEISMRAYLRRPWHCANVTDTLPPSRYTDTRSPDSWAGSSQQNTSGSKPQTLHQPQDQARHFFQDVQRDRPHTSVVLGPPGSPHGQKSGTQAQEEERLRGLEERLEEMARMLDMVKAQNADLQSRVHYLEACECVRPRCVWEGHEMEDGQRWQTDLNTVCTCTSGKVTCQTHIKDPCLSSPCHNGGVCVVLTSDPAGFRCSCPPNTKGPMCDRQLRQVSRTFQMLEACWQPRPENSCQGVRPFQRRWAFNPTSGICEDFLYCNGNSSNNFPSLNACRDQCVLGACCLRKTKRGLPIGHEDYNQYGHNISYVDGTLDEYDQHGLQDERWYGSMNFNLTELDDVRESEQKKGQKKEQDDVDCSEDVDFTYTCEYCSLVQCQTLVKDLAGEAQAVSFSPGGKCSDVSCGGGCGCLSQQQLWRYGERFRQGCEECICTRGGKVDCMCTNLTQRKEIRDLTQRERKMYQRAIRKLHAKPAVWQGFALLRAEFSSQAGGHDFFLPWHRYFLRLVERELQLSSSCQLAVPYFEWTVDSGSMQSSAAWQAGVFGGDGEPGSSCVPRHPFQGWTSRSHWSPCLRRSFNSSMWLPDAVTLQRIVNQGDFQVLSQSLQAFSGLFRLWVGGHMASPLAAYDPLYFSHMAFMDKLWTQWQEKHQYDSQTPRDDNAQSDTHYPARQRHVKMKPFDVTPDDVMSSQQQLCVVYVPITIGAPCNVTSLQGAPQRSDDTDDYNTLRYRKHGPEKHDSYRSGFDSGGFDLHGYDRDGYDHSGWDRWGYGRDGFNRDFIDKDGYDVTGFNRYGFNRSNVTWFGMRLDEVFERGKGKEHGVKDGEDDEKRAVERDKIMSHLFSDRGYSIYGFDPFGLDRGGFDAFGFHIDGYDKDRCNWFFNGPHYLRFYFHVQQQLMSSNTEALNRIARTCPPVTSLPQHWVTQDWMTLDPEEGSALISRLQQEWVGQKKSETDDSITADTQNRRGIWLPTTPDHRLCFNLHWFSGCPLGSAPIICPDLCRQARCHGYPEAVCHMHNCGSCFTEWLDPATGSHVICHGCDQYNAQAHVYCNFCHISSPGCELDGILHNVSYSTTDGCQTCTCKGGNRECSPLSCPLLDCTEQETIPGECCQRCRGCVVNGHDFPSGAPISTGDRCQECVCVNGNVVCSPLPCPALSCRNPVHHAGDCCARCEQCEYESQVYLDGQNFPSRADPCVRCRCSAGEVSCERMDATCPRLCCTHPAKPNGQCCPTCNECEYDRRVYADGKVFNPSGSGPCLQCRCKGGNVTCHEEKCPPLRCSNPKIDPHLCCPVCKACVLEGVEYEEGSQWHPEGPCSICTCMNGEPMCTHRQCPPTDCLHPTKNTGSCCAVCESCTYNHRIYSNGQRFTTPDQPCHVCTCLDGTVECKKRPCPPLNCNNSHIPHGECCPKCPDCIFENRVFVEGEAFPNPVSVCEECVCLNGRIDCHPPQCPRPNCNAPLAGTCCQNNCNGCSYAGKEYPNGQEFPHPTDTCRTCNCINGNVQCLMKRCPPPRCSNPKLLPGDCCPQCPAPPLDCVYERQHYRHTERFYDPGNTCQSCICTNGTVHCQRRTCPLAPCSHPITQECCRTCEGCLYEGRERASGEIWDDVSGACGVCMCNEGSVRCEKKRCPPANCQYPVQRKCCMACDGCMYHGQEYPDGYEFLSGDDSCGLCSCFGGEVVCTRVPCYEECSHPYTPPGQCCGECNRCFYNNAVLTNGQSIPDSSNPCSECTCQSGSVRCVKKQCTPALCPHPVTNPCGCPVCDGCLSQGVTYADGQVLPGGNGGCQDCTCSRGEVVCVQRRCPAVPCPNPALDGCACGVCDGCNFHGRDCFSGERFTHPTDHCQLCSCLNGAVVCVSVSCPSVPCVRSVIPPGECCPVCTGVCLHQGKEYQSGSSFTPPTDRCSSCTCLNEVVNCQKTPCPVQCSHPVPSDTCCPMCDSCLYEGVVHSHRHTFTSSSNPCQRCTCVRGTVTCVPLPCPPTSCAKTVTKPGQCCPECRGCMYHGQEYPDGYEFLSGDDSCGLCSCFGGEVVCTRVPCYEECSHPYTPPGQCCGECNRCFYNNAVLTNGHSIPDPSNPCSECTCQSGSVRCVKKQCTPALCPHPVTNPCGCPVCDGCLSQGVTYADGQVLPGGNGGCQDCTCSRGEVVCVQRRCPAVPCPHPALDGCACGVCDGCNFHGRDCFSGERFTHPTDHCQLCSCLAGEVQCVSPECPKLTCMHRVTDPGACCPRCRGCMYGGEQHVEGSSWFADSTPCMTCMCMDGVTTCSEVRCLSPCINTISVPGECCPVCADCVFEGRVYGPGDSFQPANDPCQICTCEVMPDGEQHLRCYRKQCPSLVDCPKNNILFSGPDSCCPVCAQPLSNCTATLIGNEVLATDDPCFTCQCKDLTWTCLHQTCLQLTCPPAIQFTPPDSCCPVCEECVIESQKRRVPNGSSWIDSDDDCVTCTCKLGHIECSIEECLPVVCQDGQIQIKTPGKCCYECQDLGVSCTYQGTVYQSNEQWEVDECTSCTCVSGDVHCHSERCPALTCATDEMPAVIPGLCCPHCLPRPATCIAFGDPHYRTFDGRMLHFQGACTYVLAQDCEDGDFSIHATNDDRGRKGVSWTKEVTVFIGNVTVQLLQDWVVKVNAEVVTLPFLKEPYVYVERQTNTILLNTNIGLKVLWSGRSHLEVSVPGSYKGHTCGLCGNFNGYHQDDLRMPSGQISLSEADFGNSWRVVNRSHSLSSCRPGEDVDPCKDAGYQARKGANGRCKVLKSRVFMPCHGVVPPEPWYGACVYDLCACGANTDECLCDTLEAYAGQCREAGVILQWRSPSLCAVGCPVERGFVFDECGPPCPVTCFNVDVPLGVIESHCFKPCVPGCQCPAGLVLHNNYCIPPEKCPKVIHGNAS